MKRKIENIMITPTIGGSELGRVIVIDLRDIKVSIEEAKQKAEAAGLTSDEINEKGSISALKDILKDLKGEELLVEVESTALFTTYQLNVTKLEEENGGLRGAEITKDCLVRLYRKENRVEADNPEMTARINAVFDKEREKLKTGHIQSAISRIISRRGEWTALTARGGVYFVPNVPEYYNLIDKIKFFVDSLPGKSYVSILPVANNPKNKEDYWKKIREALEKRVAAAERAVNELIDEVENTDKEISDVKVENVNIELNMAIAGVEGYTLLFDEMKTALKAKLDEIDARLFVATQNI